MKLLSCHIENYGKISDKDIEFDGKLTSFCEANGYGKTTLASFLKAMFYGLDTDTAKSRFNERRHFYPFSGKSFGGNLTFVSDGKEYKIERFFDEKSATKDWVRVYRDGNLSHEFDNKSIGEALFGIDKQSFERTIFISGTDIEIASTGSINTKLNNFVEGGDDNSNLEAAVKRLQEKSKEYKDAVSKEKARHNRISEARHNAEAIQHGLPAKYDAQYRVEQELAQISEQIARAQVINVLIKDWERLDEYNDEIERMQRERAAIIKRYKKGVPKKSEVDGVLQTIGRDKELNARAETKFFSADDEKSLDALKAEFEQGVPSDAELEEMREAIQAHSALSHDIGQLSQAKSSQKDDVVKQHFAFHIPTDDDVEELDRKVQKHKEAESKASAISEYITTTEIIAENGKVAQSKIVMLLLILSAALMTAGIVTVFFAVIAGIVLLAAGFVGLLAAGFLFLNRKASAHASGRQELVRHENPQRREAEKEKDVAFGQVQAFLAPYGYSLENGIPFAVAKFKEDRKRYNEIVSESDENKAQIEEKTDELQRLGKKIKTFFARYKMSGTDFAGQIAELVSDITKYIDLVNRQKTSKDHEADLDKQIEKNRRGIVEFCEKYGFDTATISDEINVILQELNDIAHIDKRLGELDGSVKQHIDDKKLTERPSTEQVDIGELNERLSDLQKDLTRLTKEIAEDESVAEELDSLKNEYAESEEKLEGYKTEYRLLEKTVKLLQNAEMNLKDKYIKPIRDQFVYYSTLLEKTLGEKITMNSNFEVQYERGGRNRSEKHLSSGQRSICSLCFRLALIDNMYSGEKPFLILDDPFVGLDEEHLKKVRFLLDELSNKLQIVYFCCHDSRAMGS
ncbi:MAG: AAA family ATPase [Clostridiales bacterium]|nr:AAA family ATPase [Clostridiales bacterium]